MSARLALLLMALSAPAAAQAPTPADDHAHHAHHAPPPPSAPADTAPLPPFIPVLTDEDRRAAFPDVKGHAVHDKAINAFVLVDQFEWRAGRGRNSMDLDTRGWIGRDIDRLWFRVEGAAERADLDHAEGHLLYGRAIARWWEVVAGVRHDVGPGPDRTWAAVGIQGLAPYWFEVEATAYIGEGGRTQLRLESEYDLLLTNRLVLQPLAEVEIHGRADPARGIGRGLATADIGLRLRYEFRREIAPYIGVAWTQRFFGTADLARAAGQSVGQTRLLTGVRLWF